MKSEITNRPAQAGRSPIRRLPRIREFVNLFFAISAICGVCGLLLYGRGGAAPLPAANVRTVPVVFTVDTPAITIAGATVDSAATPSTAAHEAQINWTFGTVTGTYTTCTVQAKTSMDGTNYLTLGSAAAVIVTTNTVNQWTVLAQAGTTTVTTSAVSSTAALGFGQLTKFTFACSAYGTSAPVTVTVIYR